MKKTAVNQLLAEVRRSQRKFGDFEAMELLVPDLNAILKGKRIRREDIEKVCKDGFWFCGGTTLLTALGETVAGKPSLQRFHFTVPLNLGQNGGGGDGLADLWRLPRRRS